MSVWVKQSCPSWLSGVSLWSKGRCRWLQVLPCYLPCLIYSKQKTCAKNLVSTTLHDRFQQKHRWLADRHAVLKTAADTNKVWVEQCWSHIRFEFSSVCCIKRYFNVVNHWTCYVPLHLMNGLSERSGQESLFLEEVTLYHNKIWTSIFLIF